MGSRQGKPRWLENRRPMTFGRSILAVLSLPLELFLYVLIIVVYGAVLTLTNILWTIRVWWKKLVN